MLEVPTQATPHYLQPFCAFASDFPSLLFFTYPIARMDERAVFGLQKWSCNRGCRFQQDVGVVARLIGE